jgi:DNA-binding CsgD family transcriptional regulator
MGWSLYNRAETEISLGDYVTALTHLREANTHFRQVGTSLGIVWTNVNLSQLTFLAGNFDEARLLVEEAQEIARDANRSNTIRKNTLILLGYLSLIEQDFQKAQFFFEEILSTYSVSPEASLGLTFIACELEDYATAGRNFVNALQPPSLYRMPAMVTLCLSAAALILSEGGEEERAVELLALASEHPQGHKDLLDKWPLLTRLHAELRTNLVRTSLVSAGLAPNVYNVAWARGQELDLTKTLMALAEHFRIEVALKQPPSGKLSLVEPLSEREMEVLQLLKTELTGPEIADEMMVSLNTFRFHTKNIYAKLQVNNRRSAVHRALELGL